MIESACYLCSNNRDRAVVFCMFRHTRRNAISPRYVSLTFHGTILSHEIIKYDT